MLGLKFSKILICLAFAWLVLLPIVVPLALILLILNCIRKLMDFIVTHWIHPDWTPIYSPDAVFANLFDKPYPGDPERKNCYANYCSVITFEEPIGIEEIRTWYKHWTKTQVKEDKNGILHKSQVYQRISRIPKRCLWYYYWAPVQIDWEKVIIEWNPGPSENFDEYLIEWLPKRFVGEMLHEILVARPTSGKYVGKTVLCSKLSHIYGDAVSATKEVLGIGFGFTPGSRKEEEIPKFIKPSWAEVLFNIVTFPRIVYQLIRLERVPTLSNLISTKACASNLEVKMISVLNSVPLSTVKSISRAFQVPFREILACITTSALRRLMLKKKILKESELPNEISCMVPIVWPYERSRGFQPLGNNATTMLFTQPMKLDNPVERLRIAHKSFLENLQCGMHRINYYGTWLSYLLPAPLLESNLFSSIPLTLNSVDFPSADVLDLPFLGTYSALPARIGIMALTPHEKSFATDCLAVFWTNAKENLITAAFLLNSKLIPNEIVGQELTECFKLELQELLDISVQEQSNPTDKDELIVKVV